MLAHITEFSPDQIVAIEDMIEAATEHVGGLPAAPDFTIQDPGRYVIDPFAGQALDDEMIRIRADTLEEHDEWRWREANPGPDVTLPPPDKWAAIRAGMPELSMEGREALVARRKEKDTAEVVEIEKAREAKARAALDEEIAEEKRTRKEAWKKREAAEQERRDAEQERRDALPTPSLRPMFDIVHDVGAELSWQADGLTPHGGIMLFAGGKSAGKSTLARTYALAVARGDEFLGREVEQGPVVVASLEDPLGVSSEHWHLLGLREDDPVFGWNGQLPEDPASWLDGVHRKVQPALILIDSFGRWTRGKASMNSYDEIIAITEDVLAFCRATQCVVAFTHHIRKGGGDDVSETVSGSMALIGLMDTTRFTCCGMVMARGQSKRPSEQVRAWRQLHLSSMQATLRSEASSGKTKPRKPRPRSHFTSPATELGYAIKRSLKNAAAINKPSSEPCKIWLRKECSTSKAQAPNLLRRNSG